MTIRSLSLLVVCLLAGTVRAADVPAVVLPFECATWGTPENAVDAAVQKTLRQHGARLRNPCSDDVFIRRVYLDVIGTLPTPEETEAFLADHAPDKRAKLIDALFTREAYADYWAMKWCDVLRVKSEFPINLWPNAAQAYHRWIRQALYDNLPYDQFARTLLTSSGSNFRVPPVNFYRALPARDTATIARGVALTFMGTRLEHWPAAQGADLAHCFSRVAYKRTDEWKEEIVFLDPQPLEPLKVVFPDGTTALVPADADPRQAFADWLITPKNPWFARAVVNRLWAWTMGQGIIDEADDIRPDNPPASPETLAVLERALVDARYDLRAVFRLILTSRTYQQSSLTARDDIPAIRFAHYGVRRLDAEVLLDALCWIGGAGEGYVSATPEPYTYIPKENRAIALADGSITSTFLATFGRPARDTGLMSERNHKPTDTQRLYLLNSSDMQKRIAQSPRLRKVILDSLKQPETLVSNLYVTILSRPPTADESAFAVKMITANVTNPGSAANDVAWSLVNSKEFLYRH